MPGGSSGDPSYYIIESTPAFTPDPPRNRRPAHSDFSRPSGGSSVLAPRDAASPDPYTTRVDLLSAARKVFSLLLTFLLLMTSVSPVAAAYGGSDHRRSYEVVIEDPRESGVQGRPGLVRVAIGNVMKGSIGIADFRGMGLPLRRVIIKPAVEAHGVEVTAELLSVLPQGVPPLTSKRVYAYLDISVSLSNSELEYADVEFSLPRSWMRANSVIVAYHYTGSKWEELPTEVVQEDLVEITFSAKTPGFSVFSFVDNENKEFEEGEHENTENVDNHVRLISGYTQGRFTSHVFDAGGIAQWDNLEWSFTEPEAPDSDTDYVGAEPDPLVDGTARTGSSQGSYTDTQSEDGVYENILEFSTGGTTVDNYVYQENVYEGGTIDFENAQADDENYENIYENLYIASFYEYVDNYAVGKYDPENYRGWVENFENQQQEGSGYSVLHENGPTVTTFDNYLEDGDFTTDPDPYWDNTSTANMTNGWDSGAGMVYAQIAASQPLTEESTFYQYFTYLGTIPPDNATLRYTFYGPDIDLDQLRIKVLLLVPGGAEYTIFDNTWTEPESVTITETFENDILSYITEKGTYKVTLYVLMATGPGDIDGKLNWDNVFVEIKYTGVNYGLEVFENIENIPSAENYYLEIYYQIYPSNPNNTDIFYVQVENSSGNWNTRGTLNSQVFTTWSYQLLSSEILGGENVHIKFVDNDNTKVDYTDLRIDYVRVRRSVTSYRMDVQHTVRNTYSSPNFQVKYYTAGDSEGVTIYFWNYDTGTWDNMGVLQGGTAGAPNSFTYDLTNTNYILAGKVKARYRQQDSDTVSTSLMIDYCRIRAQSGGTGYQLNWQYTITNVTAEFENYDLKVRGYTTGDSEFVLVSVRKGFSTASTDDDVWEDLGYLTDVEGTLTLRLSPLENYLDVDNVYVRLKDQAGGDAGQTIALVDLCRLEEAFMGTSNVRLQVRVSEDNLNWTDWMGPDGTPNTYFENTYTSMENVPDNRYIQYRIYFSSNTTNLSGESGPKVDWIRINASTLPNLIYPADGVNIKTSTPTFQWETVSADNYRIQIATNLSFTDPIVDNSSIPGTENTWTPPDPLSDNFYYWRIQRYFNSTWYAWTQPETFRIDTIAPDAPTLVSPEDGENLGTNTPFFDWDPITEENSFPILYKLQVARNSTFTDLVYETGWLENDNYLSSTLSDNTYYWRVRSKDNAGNENADAWSPCRSFRVDNTAPGAPTLQSPAPGAWVTATPNLDWEPITGDASPPVMYYVEVAADIGFTSIVENSGWISDDNWVTPSMPHATARYWRVRARDNVLNVGAWSENRSFVADTKAPSKVSLYYPADGENVESLSITFQWTHVTDDGSGLANYRIQIDDDPSFSSPLVDNSQIPAGDNTYQYTFSTLGVYYWRVCGIDNVGNGDNWSDSRTFACRAWWSPESWTGSVGGTVPGWQVAKSWSGTVEGPTTFWTLLENWTGSSSAPVPAPVLLSPDNGTNMTEKAPTLDWDNLMPADSYWIWVDNDEDFSSPIVSKPKTVSNYDFDEDLIQLEDGVYYWRVRMTRSEVDSENSETWWFRVDTVKPAAPTIISPVNGENENDSTPTITWENVTLEYDETPEYSTPVLYQVIIDNDEDFSSPENISPWISENSYTPGSLQDNLYYVRVRAKDNAGNVSDNSQVTFRIDTVPPAVPVVEWPKDDAWTKTAPTLRWGEVDDNSKPVRYHVQIATENWSNFTIVVENEWIYGGNWTVSSSLTQGYYYWRVRAIDNAGNPSAFCVPVGFRVDATLPPQVELYSPENLYAFENGEIATLAWQTTDDTPSGTENYWIQIDDDPSFTTPLVNENQAYPDNDYQYVFPEPGTYYWRVKAVDKAGNEGPWSETRTVRISIWTTAETWSGAIYSTVPGWGSAEEWSGQIFSIQPVWGAAEQWTSTIGAPAQWHFETWSGNISSAQVIWQAVESWAGASNSVSVTWSQAEAWGSEVNAPVSWTQAVSWSGMVHAPVSWMNAESWSGALLAPVSWLQVESWSGTVHAPVSWLQAEVWSGEVGAPVSWVTAEGWSGSVNAPVSWVTAESWSGFIAAPVSWLQAESWGGIVNAPVSWISAGVWSGIVNAPASWAQVEGWSGAVETTVSWSAAEEWSGTVNAPVSWTATESWSGNVAAPVSWVQADSWSGAVSAPVSWSAAEEWSGTVNAPVSWILAQSWSGVLSAPVAWLSAESWLGNVNAPVSWTQAESWSGNVGAPAAWSVAGSWNGTIWAPVSWAGIESWSGTVISIAPVWFTAETWSGTVNAPVSWAQAASWSGSVNAPVSWVAAETWFSSVNSPAAWSQTESWSGGINAPVPAPVLISPPDNTNTNNNMPYFDWDNLQPADTFKFQYDTDPNFGSPVEITIGGAQSWYQPAEPLSDALYYWRVRMIRTEASSPWSENWKIRVDTSPPGKPTLLQPFEGENENDNTPLFKWENVPELSLPLTYELEISTDNTFDTVVYWENRLPCENREIPQENALADNLYYWHVRVWDNAGNPGSWSDTRKFRIDRVPPEAPVHISPVNNGWTNSLPTFSWYSVTENSLPVRYHVEIWALGELQQESPWILENTWTASTELAPGVWYTWKVQARDNAGNTGSFSTEWKFRVDVTAPPKVPLLSPENQANFDNSDITLMWYTVKDNATGDEQSGIASYTVQIDDDEGFSSPLVCENVSSSENTYQYVFPDYGRYYWRVKAWDLVGNEGEWSDTWTLYIGRWCAAEVWSATASSLQVSWHAAEEWSGDLATVPLNWSTAEEWSATVGSIEVAWWSAEEWSGNIASVSASWINAEGWASEVNAPSEWSAADSWTSTVTAPSEWSAADSWTSSMSAPVPSPVLLEPPNLSGQGTTEITFKWDNVLPADNYTIQVDDENTFDTPLVNQVTASKSYSYDAPGTGFYYWHVMQRRTNAESEWSATWRVAVDVTAPEPPVLTSPLNHENTNDNTPLLDWEPVDENSYPVRYDALVYNALTNNQVRNITLYDSGTGENTEWEITPALPDNYYYWKVYATDNAGWSSSASSTWYFRVDTLPPVAPSLASPSDGFKTCQTSVNLSWYAVTENSCPVLYYVSVSDTPSFAHENFSSGWTENENWTASLYDGHWYWRVRAMDNAGNVGDWSENRLLIIDVDAPAAPNLTSPPDNYETNDNTVFLDWDPVTTENTGAEEDSPPVVYYVSISDDRSFPYENFSSGWIDSDNWTTPPLPDSHWYWRVRAMDNAGNVGDWSENRKLTTDTTRPTVPVPSSPHDMENTDDNTPTLMWAPSFDLTAVVYYVWVATDNQFENVTRESGWISENYWTVAPELPDNLYYWRVIAKDTFNNLSDNSETFRFRVDRVPPAPPTPIWPNASINDNSPNFTWTAPEENSLPLTYRVTIYNILKIQYHQSEWVSDENYSYTSELADDEWYWKVQARDNAGNVGDQTDYIWFKVDTKAPAAPTLVSPIPGENENDNTPVLDWEQVFYDNSGGSEASTPVRYKVWIATDPSFSNMVDNSGWITEDSWTAPPLQDGVYYWRVCAKDTAGNVGENSETRSFRVDTLPPENVELLSPENGELVDNTPLLRWTQAADNSLPVLYRVLVYHYDSLVRDSNWIAENSWTVTPDLPDADYVWKVQAKDNAGNLYETENRWFRVDTMPPGPPALYSPIDGENTNDNTPLLDWEDNTQDPSQPVTYKTWIATDSEFTNVVRTLEWTENDWWEVTPALPDNVYYWRVCAKDSLNNIGENSATRWFRVDTLAPPKPTLYMPQNGMSTENFTVGLEWSTLVDNSGVTYHLQVGAGSNFEILVDNDKLKENTYQFTATQTGLYVWRVRAYDNAGNWGEWSDNYTFAVGMWSLAESWSGTMNVPVAWFQIEVWSGTVNAPVSWTQAVSWSGMVHAPVSWMNAESWSGALGAPVSWLQVESWSGTVHAPVSWLQAEVWSGEVGAPVSWVTAEGWSGSVNAPVSWLVAEGWSGSVNAPVSWVTAESWSGFIAAPVSWLQAESWGGIVNAPVSWISAGVWSGIVNAPASWLMLELWTGLVKTFVPGWFTPETWSGSIKAPAAWLQAVMWAGLANAPASWYAAQSWTGIVETLAGWYATETWSGAVGAPVAWISAESWTGKTYAPGPAPTLLSPENCSTTNDNTPTFTWENMWIADNWEIWVDNDADFQSPVLVENTIDNFFTSPELEDENYHWRVRGWLGPSTSPFSSTFSVMVDTVKPSVPPKSDIFEDTGKYDWDMITADNTVRFVWGSSTDNSNSPTGEKAGIKCYEIIVDDDLMPPYLKDENTDNLDITLDIPDGVWKWIVRAWDWAGNVSDNEAPWTLTVDTIPPDPPALTTPANNSATRQTSALPFEWEDMTTKDNVWKYWIQIDNDSTFPGTHPNRTNTYPTVNSITKYFINDPKDENYCWRVKVYDIAGNGSDWSEVWWVMIDTKPPLTPVKSLPENDDNITSSSVLFVWGETGDESYSPTGEVAGIATYEIWVDEDPDFGSPFLVENLPPTGTGSVEFENTLPDNIYYWRVRAWDRAGNAGSYQTPWKFTVDNNPPPTPSLTSPENLAMTNDNTPTFTWSEVYDVTGVTYEIWIDNVSSFDSPFMDNTENTFYTLATENALTDENYYWKIRAWDGKNWSEIRRSGDFSAVRVLLIDTRGPPAPSSSPAVTIEGKKYAGDGLITGDNQPYVHWNRVTDLSYSPTGEVSGTMCYELQIDNDNNFTSVEYYCFTSDNVFDHNDENYPVGTGFPDENYSFRVRAWDWAGNPGDWSLTWTFIVDTTPPTIPQLKTPENNDAENVNAVLLEWYASYDATGVDHYIIEVDNDPSFLTPLESGFFSDNPNNIKTTNITVIFPENNRYYWHVKAVDLAGKESAWSESWEIVIDCVKPLVPSPLLPDNSYLTSDNTPIFSWTSVQDNTEVTPNVSGVENYILEIDSSPDFSSSDSFVTQENTLTLPSDSSLAVGTWYWRVHAVDRAGNHGDPSGSFTLHITDLTLSLTLSDNIVNPGENFTISGRASWQPENLPVDNRTVHVYVDNSLVENLTTDNQGYYSTTYATDALGTHEIRVTLTDNEGIQEENTASFSVQTITLTVSLDDYIVNPGEGMTVSGQLTRWLDSENWVNENRGATDIVIYIDDNYQVTLHPNESGNYSGSITAPENLGAHAVHAYVTNPDGITGENQTDFQVKTVHLAFSFERGQANPAERIEYSGVATLLPDGTKVENKTVEVWLGSSLKSTAQTNPDGSYHGEVIMPDELGTYQYTAKLWADDEIKGENTAMITVKRIDLTASYSDNIVNPNQPNQISGTAFLMPDNQPIADQQVTFTLEDETGKVVGGATGYTGPNGTYTINFDSPGTYGVYTGMVTITYQDFSAVTVRYLYVKVGLISLYFDDNVVNLTQDFWISGIAKIMPDNAPVANAEVEIYRDGIYYDNTVTDENGHYSYNYTEDSIGPEKRAIKVTTTSPEGIACENTQYFEKRVLQYSELVAYDSHDQFDSVLNPGENFYPSILIVENNGTEIFTVHNSLDADLLRAKEGDYVYVMSHVREGRWRVPDVHTAPTSLGQYYLTLDIMGSSENGISTPSYGRQVLYYVKDLSLELRANDYTVNPGQQGVFIYGTVTLLPDETPVGGENVVISFGGENTTVTTAENGYYYCPLTIPAASGVENVRASMVDSMGLEGENSISITIGTIEISLLTETEIAGEGQPFRMYGVATRRPENTPVKNTEVKFYIDNSYVESVWTGSDGAYEINHTFQTRGLYEIKVTIVDQDGITGENSRDIIAGRPLRIWDNQGIKSVSGEPMPVTMTFYEVGTSNVAFRITTAENGTYDEWGFAGYFDLEIYFPDQALKLRYENLNLNGFQAWDQIYRLIEADTPPAAYVSVPGTRGTLKSIAVRPHQVFIDNYDQLVITFDYSSYIQQIGDVWYLRVYRTKGYQLENRLVEGGWKELGGTLDVTNYTITAIDNEDPPDVAYAVAEYDPLSAVLLTFENAVSDIQETAGLLGEMSQDLMENALLLADVVDNLKQTVGNLATQENIASLAEIQGQVADILDNVSSMLSHVVSLENTSLGLTENLWDAFIQLSQVLENASKSSQVEEVTEQLSEVFGILQQLAPREALSIDPSVIWLEIYQGETTEVFVRITNTSTSALTVHPEKGVRNWPESLELDRSIRMSFDPSVMTLQSAETHTLTVTIVAGTMVPAGVYSGEVLIKDTGVEKAVPVAIRVRPWARGLFDLSVTSMVKTSYPGGRIPIEVQLKNMGIQAADVEVTVTLETVSGSALATIMGETVKVDVSETKVQSYEIEVPENIEEGQYVVKAVAVYKWNGDEVTISGVDTVNIEKFIKVSIRSLAREVEPGGRIPFEVEFRNTGSEWTEVNVVLRLLTPAGEPCWTETVRISLEPNSTEKRTYEAQVPTDTAGGAFALTASGEYVWLERAISITEAEAEVQVKSPPFTFFGLSIPWLIISAVAAVAAAMAWRFSYRYYQRRKAARRRFEARLFMAEIPKSGPDAIRIGRLAEAPGEAYLDINDLRMHVMTAGATGGGKTISSMVIAEEALLKGKNVIVFDPTAQWTGFLKKCTSEKMLSYYKKFGMKESDARGFPGVVKLVVNPRQKLDMKELLGEEARGKITVFVIERLKPGDMDVFITNVIQSIFESQPMEYPGLKTLLIFDEVHRLLPRFGGTGAGVIQLERAVREFRKWGIGVMLISQVMGDFEEEIRSNIRTQVQFWTREKEELDRISRTYGEEHMRSVSKAPVGFGMLVNPDYNRGRPYYINFRPILHEVQRLNPKQLDRYYAADERIENIKYKLRKLEEKGVDVFDLRIELGLAQRKLEEASFDMVDAYLDSLEPRVENVCAQHKMAGLKRVIELRSEKEIKETQLAALRERERRLGTAAKRPPEIVEAYKELLARATPVRAGKTGKPMKEEMVHPMAEEGPPRSEEEIEKQMKEIEAPETPSEEKKPAEKKAKKEKEVAKKTRKGKTAGGAKSGSTSNSRKGRKGG